MDWDIDAARKVTFDEEEKLSPPTAAPSNTPARTTPASRLSIDSLIEQEGAGHLAPVIKALYGQESGSGANNRTSVDGARSGMQVIPSTFSRFADKGWDINNEEHGLRAGIRYAKYLGDKFGNDPSKIAAGYFSGEGNVPRQGAGAFIRDTRDGNGKSVSGYVADIQRRLGPQQAPAAPSYPRWAEVAAKPEYQSMQPEEQDATRRRYFVENIAPQIPTDQLDATWAQFDADSRPKSNTERVLDRGKEFLSAITGTAPQQSVMEGYAPPGSPDTNKSPVIGMSEAGYNKYREQFLQKTPEQLQRLSAQGGVMGQLADRVLQEKSAYTAKVQSGLATKTDELAMTGRLAPATAEEKAAQPISAADFAKDLWTAIKGTPTAVAGTAASLAEGSDPTEVFGKKDWKDTAIEAARKQMADSANGPAGDAEYIFGITRSKLRNFPQQLSYSLLSMGAGLAAGLPAAAGVAATGVGAPAAPAAGYAAGAAAAGMAAYRMDTNGFLRDIRQSLDQAAVQSRGKPLTDEEFVKVAEKYQGLVQKHGLYEALPEAASQVFGFALGKTIVKNAMQGGLGALARGVGAAGLEFGNELGTETFTQLGQHNTEVEAGTAGPDAKPRSFTSLKDIKDSAAEVLPDVLMLTGVMAGGAHVGGKAYAAAERKLAPGRVIGRELHSAVNGTEFTKEGIDQAARDALLPSGPEEVSPSQTSKASVAPTAEIAGGAGVATANAPDKDLLGADEVVPAGKNAIADELAQLEKPEAPREEDKALGSEIAKALEPAYGSGSVSVVRPEALPDRSGDVDGRRQLGKDEYADIEQLGQLFGKRVVLFDSTNDQHPDAFVRRADNGTIYLNTKAADAGHSVLFGHELDHLMSREAPEIHKAWREAVMAAVPDLAQRAGEFYPNPVNPKTGKPLLTDEAHQAEIVADLMGNRFAEPEFRQTLFNNLAARSDGRTVLKKALDIIQGLIDKVKALGPMKKFKADALVSDLKKVRREAARALGKYVVMQQKAKAAGGSTQQQAGSGEGVQASFAGRGAKTADLERLAQAKARIETGEGAESVRKETGWQKGLDDKWRFEVDDSKASLDKKIFAEINASTRPARLGSLLAHEELFNAYPDAEYLSVDVVPRGVPFNAKAAFSFPYIHLAPNLSEAEALSSIVHEVQHWIQEKEGFARGGSIEKDGVRLAVKKGLVKDGKVEFSDAFDEYRKLAGEVEARNTQARLAMGASERRLVPPLETADVAEADVVLSASARREAARALGKYVVTQQKATGANPDVTASAKRVASTPEFKKWFGDSKVVDEKGEPLVVYHGTNADFEAFDHDLNGSSGQGSGEFGFFFDSSPANAARYVRQNVDGGSVVPVFVSLQNPLRVEKYNRKYGYEGVYSKTAFFNFIDDALENGHDGAIFYDVLDRGSRSTQFVAFRPEQIKSAIGNSGAFDPTNPDTTASARRGPYTTSRMAEMNRGFIEKKESTAFKVVEEDGKFYLESTNEKPQGQADRAAAAQERPAEEPRAAVRDNGRPAQATPRHGKPREGAVEVEGVHFSTGERGTLVGGVYGSGLKGIEAERIAQSNDPRLKSRIYFYVNEGSGVKPEPGVGSIAHRAKLSNVYDASADNDGLFMRAKGDMNAFESAVLDAGYDGYYTRQAFSNMGAAVLLGSQAVNVQRIGQGAQDRSASAVAPPPVLSEDRKAADVLLKSNNLPSGARTGQEWATFLQKAAPRVYAALERNDLTSWLAGEGLLYRDQVGKKLREAIAGVTASAKRDDLTDTYAAENKTGVIVGARPGEFNWNPGSDGEPAPIQHPVQRGPRLEKIGEGVRKILSSKQVGALVSDLFGVQNLTVSPTLGSWQGKSEPSFVLAGDNLTFEAADDLSKLLGFAFAQDATVVTQPRFGPSEDEIPAFYVGAEKRLSGKQLSAILEAARAEGLDYTTTTDGRAVKFLYFGDEDGLAGFQAQVDKIADAAKLPLRDVFFVRSSLNEAENYTAGRGGEAGQKPAWLEDGGAGASGLFGRAVDHLIVPYARLVGSEGYRFSPDRFGERFGLTADQVALIRSRLRPKSGLARSTAPLLTGEEKLEVQKNDLRAKEPRSNNTDIMWALQNRAAQTGLIEPGDYSPEARKVIAQAIADEIIHHVSRPGGKSAIGWYDAALKRAKDIYDGLFPEITNDPAKEMLFDAVLGITSQGNDVFANSLFAVRLYQLTNRQGMTLGEAVKTMAGSFGPQTRAIEGNLLKLEHLVNVNGYERMRGLFNEKKTVAEWNAILRRDESLYGPDGKPLSVEGAARQRVTGWMVFGPKIGSFINNLDGDYSTLTADLWFSRSWNRILGYSFIHSPQLEAKQYQRFKEEILAEHNGEAEGQGDLDGMTDREIDALLADPEAMLDLARGLEKTFREGVYKQKSDLRRAAKNWVENRDLSVAVPRSDHERAFQQDAMEDAQQIIKRKTGQKIEIADMQAALWYHEKELFRHFGASDVKREPADYADAAKRTAKIYRDGDLFYVDKPKPRYILGEKGDYLSEDEVTASARREEATRAEALLAEAKSLTAKIRARSMADRAKGLDQISEKTFELNQRDSEQVSALMREAERLRAVPAREVVASPIEVPGAATEAQQRAVAKLGRWSSNKLTLRKASESINTSAQASFTTYEILPGVFDVGIADLGLLPGYDTNAEKRRIDTLAASIEESEEIEPIFVGLDDNGETWIMEGQHRTRALSQLGYSSVPARIVVDLSDAITASAQRDPAIVSQAIDRAIAREQGRRVSDLSRESATVKLRSLRRQLEAGKIDEGRFIFEVDQLSKRLDLKAADKAFAGPQKRVRGADFVRQKILEAKRNEDITAEEADFLEWFALKNPALLDDLGISVRAAKDHEKGAAGRYMPASRVMVLMRGATNKTTAVHETLHHLERLMPAEMQEGIRGEWLGAVQTTYREAVKTGDKGLQRYTELVTLPTMRSMEDAGRLLKNGKVDRAKYYQLLNASEFWAVRMTEVAQRRFAADSVWAKSVQWLREALEHIKGALGLRSDAPMLRALNDLLKNGDGKAKSKEMLGLGMSYEQITPEQALETNVPVDLPEDPIFGEAVANTPGATITADGLSINLVRFQKPEQEGAQAIRTGVFYLPGQSANTKHYKTGSTGYGGTEKFSGETLLRRPLFVKGATGGKVPEAAWDALNGKGAMKKLDSEVMSVVSQRGWMSKMDSATYREVVENFLRDKGADPGLASEILRHSTVGNTLRYALQENVIAHAVRAAGYDSVVGYSRGKAGAFISEVFDVREQTFPARGMDSQVHDDFLGDVQASVVRKALDARDNALRRLDAAVDGLANLPDQFDYLTDRYRTLGRIARVDEITSEIRKAFDGVGAADKQAVYDYLTNAGANANQIGPRDLRDMALRLKRTINYVGDQLVSRGLLDPAVRAKFKDQYLPRMYLKHLMSNQDWKILGAGKKPSDMGYLKERKNIPEEVRELILGEVKDPAFLGANAIGRSMRDIAILDWLGKISQNGNWVFPGVMLDFKGQQVSAYYLKAEADRIEGQIPHYTPANQAKAKKLVQDMRDAARQALANLDVDHTLYKQIPDTHRYGMLRGLYVRKEIHSDIMGMSAAVNPDPTWFEKVFGMGHIGTKLTQYWKFTKVALNPPGQVRNFVSNMVMLQLSGVPLHKLPLRFAEAVRDIKANGPYWKVAKKYGVTESTFNAQELFRIKDDLLSLEAAGSMNPISWIKLTAAKVFEKVSDAYQFTEALGKTMKIIDVMKAGGTEAEAAIEAQKWLFDYSLVPQWVRVARNSPVGMPFITYSIKVLPRLVEVATTAPWRLLPWVGLLYGMAYYAAASFGVDKDDLDKLKKALPEWLQDKGFAAFLPMKDGNGRVQVLDMSYFFPWTFYTDLSKHAMEGKGGKVLQDLAGMFSSPVIGSSANLVANYDSFTKKPIYNPADPPSYQAAAITNYLYDLMAPPVISSHGVLSPMGLVDKQYGGKLVQGLTGTTNKFGDPRATTEQALWSVLGVNFYGMDPAHTRATNLLTMSRKVQDAEARLKQKLYDRSLTEEQRAKAVGDYKERMMELGQEAKRYAEESQVPEKLKARR